MTEPDERIRYRLQKPQKLRSPAEFDRVYERKQKAGDDLLLVFAAPNGGGPARIGLSVSRKHGNAVRRARLKRMLREAFRLHQHAAPGGIDLILIPRQGAAVSVATLGESIVRLSRRLARRFGVSEGAEG